MKIDVPASTPIVRIADATAADIRPGASVFVPATKGEDGALGAGSLVVGRHGAVPPM